MTIVICDDDEKDIDRLKVLIEKYDSKMHIGISIDSYNNGNDFLKAIEKTVPDIIFLDINMEELDGLSLAGKIREQNDEVPIILVTAFINYALDGYKVRASRFLVKDDLDKTLPECMDDIHGQLQKKNKHVFFSCVEGEVDIKLSEIVFIEVMGHKSIIHLENHDYHMYESLDVLEERLKAYGFLRVHQSYLVNIRHIRSINNYVLVLDTGEEMKVPKARYKQVKQERALYMGKTL